MYLQKQELVKALVNSIDHLNELPSLAQKHQIFHAIETILAHPSMDSTIVISQVLPRVFILLKNELPKEAFYAVHILTVISKKCLASRQAVFEMAEYLMVQLKANYQLFHDELNSIVERYGDVLSLISDKENILVVEREEEAKEGQDKEGGDDDNSSTSSAHSSPRPNSLVNISPKSSSSSLLNLILSAGRSTDNLSQLEHCPPSPLPPPDLLPCDVLPDFIHLLRRKTDLHFEALGFLRLLASSSGPDFDPEHHISAFIVHFAEW